MSSEFFDELKDLLVQPVAAFQKLKEKPIIAALGFFAMVLLIFSVLSSIVDLSLSNPVRLIIEIIVGYISLFVVILLCTVILHLFVYLVGGRAGGEQTIKVALYAFTPFGLIGWIPFVGLLGMLWSLILTVLGVREFHDLSTGRAVIAVILPFILLFILLLVLVMVLGFAAFSYFTADPTSMVPIPLN